MVKKIKKSKASKPKVRTIIRRVREEDLTPRIKSEVSELEKKREATMGTGFRGFLRRANLNKQINDKMAYIKTKDKLRNIDQNTQLVRKQVELENAKSELKKAREKSQVNFNGFGQSSNKELRIEDIFK